MFFCCFQALRWLDAALKAPTDLQESAGDYLILRGGSGHMERAERNSKQMGAHQRPTEYHVQKSFKNGFNSK